MSVGEALSLSEWLAALGAPGALLTVLGLWRVYALLAGRLAAESKARAEQHAANIAVLHSLERRADAAATAAATLSVSLQTHLENDREDFSELRAAVVALGASRGDGS